MVNKNNKHIVRQLKNNKNHQLLTCQKKQYLLLNNKAISSTFDGKEAIYRFLNI